MRKSKYKIASWLVSLLMNQYFHPSLKSRLIYYFLGLTNFSERIFRQLLTNPDRGTNQISSDKLNGELFVDQSELDNFKIATVRSKKSTAQHTILLHGGAYFAEAVKGHRQLIEKLVLLHDCKVSFIDYPLAPENNATTTLSLVEKAFNKIANEFPDDEFLLFGDSAGGGLALALIQILRDNKNPKMPLKTVLVSPWLDISMSNSEISGYTAKDVLLNYNGLKKCGKIYAQDLDLKDPKVSPIYGNLENLSKIKIFVSDSELFYPDCLLLKRKLDSASGSTAFLSIKEKMIHDWIVLPIKERDDTIYEVVNFYCDN
jgi:monoterpene epsilon-lactone hydrolase